MVLPCRVSVYSDHQTHFLFGVRTIAILRARTYTEKRTRTCVRHPFPSPCCVLSPGIASAWPRRHAAQCTGELLCLLNPFPSPCCVLSPGIASAWPRRHTAQCTGSVTRSDLDLALFFVISTAAQFSSSARTSYTCYPPSCLPSDPAPSLPRLVGINLRRQTV
jgi:hypothetical protein